MVVKGVSEVEGRRLVGVEKDCRARMLETDPGFADRDDVTS